MARVLIVVGLLALAFTVYSLVDCALADRARIRALPRPLWIVVILVLPVLGGVLWFLIGAGRVEARGSTRYVGPDDDPEFIRGSGTAAQTTAVGDDEWQRLEQELAAMDDTDDEGDARRR